VIEVNVDTSEVIPEIEGPITAVGLGYGTFESVVKIVTNLTITGARVMLKTNLTASSVATDVEKGGAGPLPAALPAESPDSIRRHIRELCKRLP
jgi:hypothetical protein